MKQNSLRAWVKGARPYSLPGAAAPVLVGGAWAVHTGGGHLTWAAAVPVALCLLFALVMQVAANLINDYVDYKKGTDRPERVGPSRMFANGLITERAMRWGIGVTTVIGCCAGLPLVAYGGWPLVVVGVLCVAGCYLYSTHLSYRGWGDALVVLFFGVVPVFFTYYCAMAACPALPRTGDVMALLMGLGMGMVTDCLLVVNNYRDREQDPVTGKRTLVVMFGGRFGLQFYLWLGVLGALVPVGLSLWSAVAMVVYLVLHLQAWARIRRLEGQALNAMLGVTARNMLCYGLLLAVSLII